MAAGAISMLVLSGMGALIIDRVRTSDDPPPTEALAGGAEEVPSSATSTISAVSTVPFSSTPKTPPATLKVPVVTFQADEGQAFVAGAVPSAEVADRISSSLAGIYGQENVVATGIVVDANTASAPWMATVDTLVSALGGFDDYRLRFEGDTITGFVGGGAEFTLASADVPPGYDPILAFVAEVMGRDDSLTLVVTGHTDSTGSEEANLALSQARAQAVVDRLVQQGVDGTRVLAEGNGPFNPTAPNDTPEGRARNRRVEFTLTVGAVAPADS